MAGGMPSPPRTRTISRLPAVTAVRPTKALPAWPPSRSAWGAAGGGAGGDSEAGGQAWWGARDGDPDPPGAREGEGVGGGPVGGGGDPGRAQGGGGGAAGLVGDGQVDAGQAVDGPSGRLGDVDLEQVAADCAGLQAQLQAQRSSLQLLGLQAAANAVGAGGGQDIAGWDGVGQQRGDQHDDRAAGGFDGQQAPQPARRPDAMGAGVG